MLTADIFATHCFFLFLAEADLSAQDLVDFSPVYKCLHIYTVLGEREEFEKYYRKQRRQQATLTLQPPSNMHESIGKTILLYKISLLQLYHFFCGNEAI